MWQHVRSDNEPRRHLPSLPYKPTLPHTYYTWRLHTALVCSPESYVKLELKISETSQ